MTNRIPLTPPKIASLSQSTTQPLWSIMIPVYNCGAFLHEAIMSILSQDMGEELMQIEVIDDASTDIDVKTSVERWGKGRITYYRQPQNMGSLRNFETCINRAKGKLVHLFHGDDRVKQGFYKRMTALFEKFPRAGAGFCGYDVIDEEGKKTGTELQLSENDCILDNWLCTIAGKQLVQYISMVVKREVYENLGSFYAATYGEDWEMWTRIAAKYPTAYSPEFLAEYRMHFNSISSSSFSSGKNIRDIACILKLIREHLPADQRKEVYRNGLRYYTTWAVKFARTTWYRTNETKIVYRQVFEALRVYRDKVLLRQCWDLVYSASTWKLKRLASRKRRMIK